MNFINTDGSDMSGWNMGIFLYLKPLLQFLNCMPAQIIEVGESLDANMRTKFQNCSFKCFSQFGFEMGKKWYMLQFTMTTTVAI